MKIAELEAVVTSFVRKLQEARDRETGDDICTVWSIHYPLKPNTPSQNSKNIPSRHIKHTTPMVTNHKLFLLKILTSLYEETQILPFTSNHIYLSPSLVLTPSYDPIPHQLHLLLRLTAAIESTEQWREKMSTSENNNHLLEEQLRSANDSIARLRKEAASAKESAAAIEKKAMEQALQRSHANTNDNDLRKEITSLKQALDVANQSLVDHQTQTQTAMSNHPSIQSLQSQLLALQSKCDTYVVELVMERKEAKTNQRAMDKIREDVAAEKAQLLVDRAQLQMEMEQGKRSSTTPASLKVIVL